VEILKDEKFQLRVKHVRKLGVLTVVTIITKTTFELIYKLAVLAPSPKRFCNEFDFFW
jgi:hypothetical protein